MLDMGPTEDVVGYSVNAGGTRSCVASIAQWVERGDGIRWLACLNPHSYAVAQSNVPFGRALHKADWLIPDGVGVVLASRLRRGAIRERVTGSDIFLGLQEHLNSRGGARVFFLGSTEDTLRRIRDKMASDFPRIRVVGTYSPAFKSHYSECEMDEMVQAINSAKPDVLWVGMTAPKQEMWIHQAQARLDVKFAAAIGAVFDFYIGQIKRSHPMFQRLGLEWLPRLLQEPRRLWRRMFVSAPIFVWGVLRSRASCQK
jgi:N-acetylglucosaminyldiphosphoundecaprenol N-acetyl-beta-D-mannosaminyltransferase